MMTWVPAAATIGRMKSPSARSTSAVLCTSRWLHTLHDTPIRSRALACLPSMGVFWPDDAVMSRTAVLSAADWARIEPFLPCSKGRRGRNFRDHRQVVEGIVFRLRVSPPWRDLPVEFGPWQTVWKRHARFCRDATWDKILTALQVQADAIGHIDWNVSVDSTIARVHQHGATAARSSVSATSHTGGSLESQESA